MTTNISTPLKKVLTLCLALLACLQVTLAQTANTITGTVKNEQGETLVGALVQATGSTERAVTDIDGHFTLKAAPGQWWTRWW